jgi:hypothetical protein
MVPVRERATRGLSHQLAKYCYGLKASGSSNSDTCFSFG